MELNIKPSTKNSFPIGGILIKHPSVKVWLLEIQLMELSLKEVQLYPIPGAVANSVWGCFVLINGGFDYQKVGKHEWCQRFSPYFYLPERSMIYPAISAPALQQLLLNKQHIMHPDFGLVKLGEAVPLGDYIVKPTVLPRNVAQPADSIFLPKQVRSFQVKPVSSREILHEFENEIVPERKTLKDKPLNVIEKGRLALYKNLFEGGGGFTSAKGAFLAKLEELFQGKFDKGNDFLNEMQQDFEELDKRNQKEVDKLLDLLKNNPEEGLKYAIPLDNEGTARGGQAAGLGLAMLWSSFALFGNRGNSGGGGGIVNLADDAYYKLQQQYIATAKELIKQKEYKKAAFVYMKLLKDYHSAAQTLEKGEHYESAAAIYLDHLYNRKKAAECYEKGNMTMKAIEIYAEMNENEKVGDLYMTLQKEEKALVFYQKVIDKYLEHHKNLKASFLYRNKMKKGDEAQAILLEAWRAGKDEFNCLNNYFANIGDCKVLKKEISRIYAKEVASNNRTNFLRVIQLEYKKKNELAPFIKEMAYEIIAAQVKIHPKILHILPLFTDRDEEVRKDMGRFLRQ